MTEPRRHQNKKLILSLLVVLSVVAGNARTQGWQVVNFPTPDDLTGIAFANPDSGFVVTHSGKIARTVNGGKTWGGVQLTKLPLQDICLLGPNRIYVCGDGGLMQKSENGGRDWKDISYFDTSVSIISIKAYPNDNLVATGLTHDSSRRNVGVLMHSTTDGRGWAKSPVDGVGFGELFSDGPTLRFCAWDGLFVSIDKGHSWKKSKLPDGKPSRTLAINGNTGIMAGNFGQVAYSEDKGRTWHQVMLPREEAHFTCVLLLDEKRGYIAGTDSRMYVTKNGGKTWSRETLPLSCDIFGLAKAGNRIWAIGKSGAMIWKSIR